MNELSKVAGGLPSTQLGQDKDFQTFVQEAAFLRSLRLYGKGKEVDEGRIPPGKWGIYISDGKIQNMEDSVDVLFFARRCMAIDMKNKNDIIKCFDASSKEFQRIRAESKIQDSSCQAGVVFLVYERTTGQFLEYFAGTKSAHMILDDLYRHLPLTPEQIEARGLEDVEPHGAIPVTLGVRYVQKKFNYHAPTVTTCSTPFNKVPSVEEIEAQVAKFINVAGDDQRETVSDKRRKR